MSEVQPGEEEELADSDRQPSLTGHTPTWDLRLFQHAQQQASIRIVSFGARGRLETLTITGVFV